MKLKKCLRHIFLRKVNSKLMPIGCTANGNSYRNKKMSFFLVAAMLLSALTFGSAFAADGLYLNENFESMELDSDPVPEFTTDSGWAVYERSTSTGYGDIAIKENNGSQVLSVNRNISGTTNQTVTAGYFKSSGFEGRKVIVDFKLRKGIDSTRPFSREYISINKSVMPRIDSTVSDSPYADAAYIEFYKQPAGDPAGWITAPGEEGSPEREAYESQTTVFGIRYGSGASLIEIADPVTTGWGNVRVVIDRQTKTYDFYYSKNEITASASPLAGNVPVYMPSVSPLLSVKSVKYGVERSNALTGAADCGGGGTALIDDLKIKGTNTWDRGSMAYDYFENFESANFNANTAKFDAYFTSNPPPPSFVRLNNTSTGWTNVSTNAGGGGDGAFANAGVLVSTKTGSQALSITSGATASQQRTANLNYLKTDGFTDGGGRYAAVQFKFLQTVPAPANTSANWIYISDEVGGRNNNTAYILTHKGIMYYGKSDGSVTNDYDNLAASIAKLEPIPTTNMPNGGVLLNGQVYDIKFVIDTQSKTFDFYISDGIINPNTQPALTNIPLLGASGGAAAPKYFSCTAAKSYNASNTAINTNNSAIYIDDFALNPKYDTTETVTFDGDVNDVSLAGNSSVNVTVKSIKYDPYIQATDAKLIFALYDDKLSLQSLTIEPYDLSGTGYTKTYNKTLNFDAPVPTGYKLKVFVWDMLNNLIPIGQGEEF
jgi:hypothetical protein